MNAKGVGLGLYICKKLVDIFEGNVSVYSEYNKGSSFSSSFSLSEVEQNQGLIARILNPSTIHNVCIEITTIDNLSENLTYQSNHFQALKRKQNNNFGIQFTK